jgi:hypothetical protein
MDRFQGSWYHENPLASCLACDAFVRSSSSDQKESQQQLIIFTALYRFSIHETAAASSTTSSPTRSAAKDKDKRRSSIFNFPIFSSPSSENPAAADDSYRILGHRFVLDVAEHQDSTLLTRRCYEVSLSRKLPLFSQQPYPCLVA